MRKPGIEPGAQRWQRWILPLNHLRNENAPRRGIEPRSTMRQTVILATKLSRTFYKQKTRSVYGLNSGSRDFLFLIYFITSQPQHRIQLYIYMSKLICLKYILSFLNM